MMHKLGVAKTARGRRDREIRPRRPEADAFAAGCAITTDFINKRPDVAKRFAAAWAKAVDFINKNPDAGAQTSRQEHHDAG